MRQAVYLPRSAFDEALVEYDRLGPSCKLARLLHSEDTVAQQLAQSEVHHQFQLRSRKFVPAKLANSLSSKEIKTVVQRQTECQHEEILQQRVLQGSMTRVVDVDDESIWASTLTTLPDAVYKWTVNSVVHGYAASQIKLSAMAPSCVQLLPSLFEATDIISRSQ